MKKKLLFLLIQSMVLSVSLNHNFIKANATEYIPGGTESLVDVDGNKIYKAGGVYLGDDLSSTSVSIRYFDTYYVDEEWYYIYNYYAQNLYALISTIREGAQISSTCVTTGVLGVLKGIEVYKNYESNIYPLLGTNIGRPHNGINNFTIWQNTSNITFSGNYYKNNTKYPLVILSNEYSRLSYVYNELIKIGYNVDTYGAAYSNIATAISQYFATEKTSENYRYILSNLNNCYRKVSNVGFKNAYREIRNAIIEGYPVLIGDDDFDFVTNSTQSQNPGGHVAVAVAAGVAQVYDCQKHQTIEVEEIIYDQGAGKYAAMPIDDVYDYFILDVKLQKKEKYGPFGLLTRWVDM